MSTATLPGAATAFSPQLSSGSKVERYVLAAFAGVIWYNAVELIVLCFVTFKRYQGCYFWSLFLASASLIPHTLGCIFFLFPLGISPYASVTLILIPWSMMVTGQSLVLWSRLRLVLQCPGILRGLLCMIIIDSIIFQTPLFVLMYGVVSPKSHLFIRGFGVMERVQLVGFCVQELVLSGIYVWEAAKMLRLHPEQRNKRILVQLLIINICILILDVAVLGVEYAGYNAVQVMFKPVAYSIKLKLEYAILGKLVEVARGTCLVPCSSSCAREILHGDQSLPGMGGTSNLQAANSTSSTTLFRR